MVESRITPPPLPTHPSVNCDHVVRLLQVWVTNTHLPYKHSHLNYQPHTTVFDFFLLCLLGGRFILSLLRFSPSRNSRLFSRRKLAANEPLSRYPVTSFPVVAESRFARATFLHDCVISPWLCHFFMTALDVHKPVAQEAPHPHPPLPQPHLMDSVHLWEVKTTQSIGTVLQDWLSWLWQVHDRGHMVLVCAQNSCCKCNCPRCPVRCHRI